MGHGTPPTAKALAHGLRPSLSIDVVTTVPGDMFTQMRSCSRSERAARARGGVRGGQRGGAHAAHVARGARVRDDRGRAGLRAGTANGLADARQAGRPGADALRPVEHVSGDRPGLDGRASGRHENVDSGHASTAAIRSARRLVDAELRTGPTTSPRRLLGTCRAHGRMSTSVGAVRTVLLHTLTKRGLTPFRAIFVNSSLGIPMLLQ